MVLRPHIALFALVLLVTSCKESPPQASEDVLPSGVLLKVGEESVTESDLEHHLKEKYAGRNDDRTRELALEELTKRAQFVTAAKASGVSDDAVIRAEISRLLVKRHRELELNPMVKSLVSEGIPEAELREIYLSNESRFQKGEQRQAAVLWLKPGADPKRGEAYREKLEKARIWLLENTELREHPRRGFGPLSVDHSEHAASRFKGGIIGWFSKGDQMDPWNQAISEILFELKESGEVSKVITRPEGIFLVRYLDQKSARKQSFEDVRSQLVRSEKQRRRAEAVSEFEDTIISKFPIKRPQ